MNEYIIHHHDDESYGIMDFLQVHEQCDIHETDLKNIHNMDIGDKMTITTIGSKLTFTRIK